MKLTQDVLNSIMREIGDRRPTEAKNNLPACPECGERYLGDGVDLCTECQCEVEVTAYRNGSGSSITRPEGRGL